MPLYKPTLCVHTSPSFFDGDEGSFEHAFLTLAKWAHNVGKSWQVRIYGPATHRKRTPSLSDVPTFNSRPPP